MFSWLKKIMLFKVCRFNINYSRLNPKNWKRLSFRKIIKGVAILIIFLGAFIIVRDEFYFQFGDGSYSNADRYYEDATEEYDESEELYCNVASIKLHGNIVTYISSDNLDNNGNLISNETASEDVVFDIESADTDKNIKAIVLETDSYGGSPVAAEEIAQALKRAVKPTVAIIRNGAISGSYWASTGANIIFASALSDIGGIGATMSYVDSSKKNIKDGLTYNSLSTGKFKDYGDSDKPLTLEERELMMRDLNIIHKNFINAVAENRNLGIEKVRALADGSSMPGQIALSVGLIDRIGGAAEVKEYLGKKINRKIKICQ